MPAGRLLGTALEDGFQRMSGLHEKHVSVICRPDSALEVAQKSQN